MRHFVSLANFFMQSSSLLGNLASVRFRRARPFRVASDSRPVPGWLELVDTALGRRNMPLLFALKHIFQEHVNGKNRGLLKGNGRREFLKLQSGYSDRTCRAESMSGCLCEPPQLLHALPIHSEQSMTGWIIDFYADVDMLDNHVTTPQRSPTHAERALCGIFPG